MALSTDGGTLTADALRGDVSDVKATESDTADDLPAVPSFEQQKAEYAEQKAAYDLWEEELAAEGARAADELAPGDHVWVILMAGGRSEVHPATAYERHPTRGWAFNVHYPGRLAFFRDVPYCGAFWQNGAWCRPGTVQEPVPVEPVKPVDPGAVRVMLWLTAVKPSGGTLDDSIRAGESMVAEFDADKVDQAAAFWKTTTAAREGSIGVLTRRVVGDPKAKAERIWDSLHGAYPAAVKVDPKV